MIPCWLGPWLGWRGGGGGGGGQWQWVGRCRKASTTRGFSNFLLLKPSLVLQRDISAFFPFPLYFFAFGNIFFSFLFKKIFIYMYIDFYIWPKKNNPDIHNEYESTAANWISFSTKILWGKKIIFHHINTLRERERERHRKNNTNDKDAPSPPVHALPGWSKRLPWPRRLTQKLQVLHCCCYLLCFAWGCESQEREKKTKQNVGILVFPLRAQPPRSPPHRRQGLVGWMDSRLPNLKCWITGNFSKHWREKRRGERRRGERRGEKKREEREEE